MKLYVGNLDFALTDEDIKAKFEEFGEVVSVKVILDRDTGRSKGFGFVEMGDADSGQRAIDELNGAEFSGRALVVNEARQREERPRRTGGGGGGYNRGGSSNGGGGFNNRSRGGW